MAQQLLETYAMNEESECGTSKLTNLLLSMPAEERYGLLKTRYGAWGDTVLHEAAFRGHTETARCLLASVTPEQRYKLLKIQTSTGDTAIHGAAYKDHSETIRSMLNTVSPDQRYELLKTQCSIGLTAIHVAACKNHPEPIKFMLDAVYTAQQTTLLGMHVQYQKERTALSTALEYSNVAAAAIIQEYKEKAELESKRLLGMRLGLLGVLLFSALL